MRPPAVAVGARLQALGVAAKILRADQIDVDRVRAGIVGVFVVSPEEWAFSAADSAARFLRLLVRHVLIGGALAARKRDGSDVEEPDYVEAHPVLTLFSEHAAGGRHVFCFSRK